ncbi:hypothetical protein M9458_055284 [Cirrhinus mrigala]|uniref:Immunoglobulin subtype domain-containing protein n=1 Tax=Cirrhinus mrigala TaxID=683832 RepID=A0ABD0MLI6_CIRMR
MEGDSVTLHTDVTEIHEDDDILWKFGPENSLIAKISIEQQIFFTSGVPEGRFRDKLKLDKQTGSLTITNTRIEHDGLYNLQISGAKRLSKAFSVSVYGDSSACSCHQQRLFFILIITAELMWVGKQFIVQHHLSLPLEVEYQDKNTYSCVINNPISNQTRHLDISKLCHTCAEVHVDCCGFTEAVIRLVVSALVAVAAVAFPVYDIRSKGGGEKKEIL